MEEAPKRVLITVESVELFPKSDKRKDPYAIDERYQLVWRDVLESGLEEDGIHTYVVVKGGFMEEGLPDRHQLRLHTAAWVTPKEATDALLAQLIKEPELFGLSTGDCTEQIEKLHGDTDHLLRHVGVNHTLGRVIAAFSGRAMRIAGHLANTYTALLHQQCDLEHERRRREQGLIKEG